MAISETIAIVDNHDRYGTVLGQALKLEIDSVGQKWLAEELGITTAAIRNWFKPDRGTIGVKMFSRVCEALQIEPTDVGFVADEQEIKRKIEILRQIKTMAGLGLYVA